MYILASAIHFEAGNIYHYSYVTEIALNEANEQSYEGAHRSVGFRFSGELSLSVVWKKTYDYLIRLDVRLFTSYLIEKTTLLTTIVFC